MHRLVSTLSLAVFATAALAGASQQARAADDKPIIIGSTLPLTGPLQSLGAIVREANEQAIADANSAGGIELGGVKHKIEYKVLDNQSNPNLVTQQARTLVLEQNAVALLGSFTPPLSIPLSNVAEQLRVPAIFTNTPIEGWQAANPKGWTYAWDIFVAEPQMTALEYDAASLAQTNKKVALFTDTEDDGVVFGDLWAKEAAKRGFEIVYHAKFPIGTSDFGQFIQAAKSANADLVFAIMIPPDGIALWKQMKALGYAPKVASCEKCAHTVAWPKVLGELAQGTLMFGWWSPDSGFPGTDHVMAVWSKKYGLTSDLETAATNFGVTQVLLDAIKRSGTAEPAAINKALGETNLASVVGPVKFSKNTVVLPAFMRQWQGDRQVQVAPADKNAAKLLAPLPGFAH
jgi:branched-chain amino acid transport system substrate-binding protein